MENNYNINWMQAKTKSQSKSRMNKKAMVTQRNGCQLMSTKSEEDVFFDAITDIT